jgi:hypothetical protein
MKECFKKYYKFDIITFNIIIGLISSIINFWNGQYNLGLAWLFGTIGWSMAELNELIIKAERFLCDEFENSYIKYSDLLKNCNDELKFYKEEYFKVEKVKNIENK